MPDSERAAKVEEANEAGHRFGAVVHTFSTLQKGSKAPRRALEASGVGGAVLVPVGLAAIEGALGIVVAVVGGLIALAAYLVSTRKRDRGLSTKIDVHEKGIVCTQGKAARELLWNEVVDISSKTVQTPDGTPSLALVFETVSPPPLLIMVGGVYGDESSTAKLLDSLRDVWMAVWCRRARVLAQHDGVRVGRALVRCECVTLGKHELAWSSITGVTLVNGVDCLQTVAGHEAVEGSGPTSPFPSAARRIATLAAAPPQRPLLPPAKRG